MINETKVRRYCADDISLIENYDKAMTDQDRTWHCHHRLEIGKNGEVISYKDLISHGLYYNRPASELIFLTQSEHFRLHRGNISEETRAKLSEANKGDKNPNFGKKHSEESKTKMSESMMGNKNFFGHSHSEETKKRMSEARKAYWERKRLDKATSK